MLVKLLNRKNPYDRDSSEWNCFEDIRCFVSETEYIPVRYLIDSWGMDLGYYENYLPVLEQDGLIKIDYRTIDDIVLGK